MSLVPSVAHSRDGTSYYSASTHRQSSGRVQLGTQILAHDTSLMPSLIPFPPLNLFLDLLASVEIFEETQPQSITSTSQAPGPRNEDINSYEGGPMISGDPCPPAIENVHTEETESECTTVESSKPHRFALASAPETTSTQIPGPGALETSSTQIPGLSAPETSTQIPGLGEPPTEGEGERLIIT